MSWSWSPTLATARDQVRHLVGDTDASDPLMSDEQIAWTLTQEVNVYGAAASVAEAIAATFARKVDKSVGDLRLSLSQKVVQYKALGEALRARRGMAYAVPTAGGLSLAEKQAAYEDADRPRPYFRVGMNDFQGPDREPRAETTDDSSTL